MTPRLFVIPALVLAVAPGLRAQTMATQTTAPQTAAPQTAATTTTTVVAPAVLRTRRATGEKIVMSNGALTEIRGNMGTRIDLDTIIPTGARITPGGTIYLSDGTTATLGDGKMLSMDGRISPAPAADLAIANSTLDAGTAGTGQAVRDVVHQAQNAQIEAHQVADPSTNDKTVPTLTGKGIIQTNNGSTAPQSDGRISTNSAVNPNGPNAGAPPPPAPSNQREVDIKRDQLRAQRMLPSQQQ